MQSLERDQLIKIRKAMELLQARPLKSTSFFIFSPFIVSWVKKICIAFIPEENPALISLSERIELVWPDLDPM